MMSRNRERFAWLVLLISFFVCAIVTISLPVGFNSYLQRATRPLPIFVQTNQGTLVLDQRSPITNNDETRSVEEPAELAANTLSDRGLIQIYEPNGLELLSRIQVYGNTNLSVDQARAPRFASSDADPNIRLTLDSGRIRITVQPNEEMPLDAQVTTPNGSFTILQDGVYDVQVTGNDVQVAVLEGTAVLAPEVSDPLTLQTDQRGILSKDGAATGPFSTERNLFVNGDFSAGLQNWVTVAWFVERQEEPSGETRIVEVFGEPALRFSRNGVGHANARVRQDVNVDVADFSQLRLFMSYRILDQTLPVCGVKGTECPLIVRLEYVDEDGRTVGWQQGIYAKDASLEADPQLYPNVCEECGSPLGINQHTFATKFADLLVFESENLIEQLQQEGFRPAKINNVQLIAQGHSFEVDVIEVGLYAQQ